MENEVSLINDKMKKTLTMNEPSEQHEGGGDCVKVKESTATRSSSTDSINFFMEIINRKTNIYSTKPVPLKSPWSFWIDRTHNGMNAQEFARSLHHIFTVYSVHEFWRVLCNIPLPSALDFHSSMHYTREERLPIWEESYNSKGGTFRFRVSKKDTDKVWRELLMATAAEHWFDFIDEADDIVGVTVSVREREDLIMIWNLDSNLSKSARVFECVRLMLPDTFFIGEFYKPHTNHHAFEKRLAAAAATSREGILDVLKHSSGDGGHCARRHPGHGGPGPYGRTAY